MDFTIDADEKLCNVPQERQMCPAGVRVMTIKHAEETTKSWKICDENPTGAVLALRLADTDGDYRFVFDDIGQHQGWKAKQLLAAMGADLSSKTVSLRPDDLVGQVVHVEVTHYTSKADNVSAVVKRYMPVARRDTQAAKPKATPRTAPPQEVAAGDIPF